MALCLAAYAALLWHLSRPLTETWDGLMGISNALVLGGIEIPGIHLNLAKPPLGSLLMALPVRTAWRAGGAEAVLRVSHACQIAWTALLVTFSWRFLCRRYGQALAWMCTALLAFNPLLLRNAPFAFFDVLGAVCALAYLEGLVAVLASPGLGPIAAVSVAGALAFLSKYNLGLLILLAPTAGLARVDASDPSCKARLWLIPPAVFSLAFLVLWALVAAYDDLSLGQAMGKTATLVLSKFQEDVVLPRTTPDPLYLFHVLRTQVGTVALALATMGCLVWIWRRDPWGTVLASSLAGSLLFLSCALRVPDARYAIYLLPILAAAVCEGIRLVASRLHERLRPAVVAVVLAVAPWEVTHRSLSQLLEEPNYHSRLPLILAQYARGRDSGSGCLWWVPGELRFPGQVHFQDAWTTALGAPVFRFYSPVPVEELREGRWQASCAPLAILLPKFPGSSGFESARWTDPELGRLCAVTPSDWMRQGNRYSLKGSPHGLRCLRITPYSLRPELSQSRLRNPEEGPTVRN